MLTELSREQIVRRRKAEYEVLKNKMKGASAQAPKDAKKKPVFVLESKVNKDG